VQPEGWKMVVSTASLFFGDLENMNGETLHPRMKKLGIKKKIIQV